MSTAILACLGRCETIATGCGVYFFESKLVDQVMNSASDVGKKSLGMMCLPFI